MLRNPRIREDICTHGLKQANVKILQFYRDSMSMVEKIVAIALQDNPFKTAGLKGAVWSRL